MPTPGFRIDMEQEGPSCFNIGLSETHGTPIIANKYPGNLPCMEIEEPKYVFVSTHGTGKWSVITKRPHKPFNENNREPTKAGLHENTFGYNLNP